MNFLAHTYLSGSDKEIMIGNFIGDHVKGNGWERYRQGIINGIRLHRMIDAFTDQHPVFNQSSDRHQHKYHKYAGVITDMYYDHLLAANWDDYSDEELYTFTRRNYMVLMKNYLILPKKTKTILPFIMRSNWLASYADLDFLQRAFQGMAIRTPFKSGMENAVSDLKDHYQQYLEEFRRFFPDIIKYAAGVREDF